MIQQIKAELRAAADPEKAAFFPRFFKAGPGQYAEGDKFLGVTVPKQRTIAKRFYTTTTLKQLEELLQSEWHEDRLTALLILVLQFQKCSEDQRAKIVELYLANTHRINNWDLVDSSAYHILGAWLLGRDRSILYKLASSSSLWERRIAVIATLAFIRNGDFTDTIKLSEQLLDDPHDLMHKAVGWMLREVGKKDREVLRGFLDHHATRMPRTALRYAIEHFSKVEQHKYLQR